MTTATETIKALLVENEEDDYLVVRDMLASQRRVRFEVDWITTYEEALAAIREHRHDIYLIDYQLGSRTGLELVRQSFAWKSRAPVILMTGHDDYEIDLEATALGVTDYVTKQGLSPTSLERAIRYAISHHSALAELAQSEERYALAVRAANDGIWDWDLTADRIHFSPRWHSILGLPERIGDAEPEMWLGRVHEDDLVGVRAAIDAHLSGRTPHLEVEHRVRDCESQWRWVLVRGLAVRDQNGRATRMAGSMSDVSQRRAAERQLQHDALHDPLTGLPNRALFNDRVDQIIRRSLRDPRVTCAVLFVDIDRFKLVNDSLSHTVGDQLLVAVGTRLREMLRPGDTVARLGGDEFALLLDGVATAPDAALAAKRVQTAFAQPFSVGGDELTVTASMGISLASSKTCAGELLRNADIAMYDAKRRGTGRYSVFDDSMHQRVVNRVTREHELRRAIERSLIVLDYQPIVDLRTGEICQLEALARWPDGWKPPLAPAEFVAIAEESGLIKELGMSVLSTAVETLASWRAAGLVGPDVGMSVNISRCQLDDPALPDEILATISRVELPAELLRLEITESTLMQEPERMQRIVSEVCAKGVGLHLDDFGTGYSSLAALLQFPVSALKIDRRFVSSGLPTGSANEAIVRSTIALAHGLGLQVIAEGIENPLDLRRLRAFGCEYGQGFLFSTPVRAEQVERIFSSWSSTTALQRLGSGSQ
jgi:diguanylate cyclase (GGDEF)-like protein/PAS domain S-box-containing protein